MTPGPFDMDARASLKERHDRCQCALADGMTAAELRAVKSCKDRWICNNLVKARKAAEKRESTSRRIAKLTGAES